MGEGAGIRWWKALFPFPFQTEAWVTYNHWRTIRIYLEQLHEKRDPDENLTWFVFYLLKMMPANPKHTYPFPILRYWVDSILSLRSYKKSFKLAKGFGMKYNASNSLCISCNHLEPCKMQHPTIWAMKMAFYASVKCQCQMPIEWDPVCPGAVLLNWWSTRHQKVVPETRGNTYICSCAAGRAVSIGRALAGIQCPIHVRV